MLKNNRCPSVLIEGCFLSNPAELAASLLPAYQENLEKNRPCCTNSVQSLISRVNLSEFIGIGPLNAMLAVSVYFELMLYDLKMLGNLGNIRHRTKFKRKDVIAGQANQMVMLMIMRKASEAKLDSIL